MDDERTQELFDTLTHVMANVTDPHILKLAARTLARHPDPEARILLVTFLRSRAFLSRLDDVITASEAFTRLRQVFAALRESPDDSVRRLCLALGRDPAFVSIDERHWLLLDTLAEVRPMDAETVAFFEHTHLLGYSTINARLLTHNGSPLALDLFCRLILDPEEDPEGHADTLHASILPHRDRIAVVEMCARLLDGGLPERVSAGVVESLYDFHSREWFGPAINPPKPPPWDSAPTDVLERLVALAPGARAAAGVSETLAAAVDSTAEELREILSRRAP